MKRIAISCTLVLLSLSTLKAQQLPATKNKLVVIAHRGNHVTVPENTTAAIEATIACGADYAEIDLRTTKDGELILMHDATVNRTTDGQGKVSDLTFEEIKKLNIKSKDGKQYTVPTFKEVLAACKGRLNIYLDFKDADVATTWQQIKAAGMEKRVVVYLNAPEQYGAWKSVAPKVPLMSSLPDEVKTAAELQDFLGKFQLAVIDNISDQSLLEVTKKNKVSVWLDVQSSKEGPEWWDTALKTKIQGLQSDHPAQLVEYLKLKQRR
ncbi:glycerophosphodiester phosphodiesterase [Chitinophaga silvatica]|uniref:Glycerophosphodiester phosphodiesterase n=1 Tax=Chitinophaga silvatica TaxID=2282649 RepID=A0A3E1Y948_9BACT|nr:glycerophosphodiester phosphodiesterase family protein [Chitinophaga silvatica]RFS21923.1 glycerophosphodiester phosphodiesterase [Chitinophaga silvatica]